MNKKGIGTIAIILIALVAVAAVVGSYIVLSNIPSDTTPDNGEPTNGEPTNGEPTNGEPTNGEPTTWSPYQFKEGEYYEYRSTVDPVGTVTWEVVSVSGDQITVEYGWDVEEDSGSMTIEGNKDTVYQQVIATPGGAIIGAGFYAPWIEYYTGYGLKVGNTWSITTSEGTFSVGVTGTETYGGQESHVGEARLNDKLLYKVAVSKDIGFPTYVAIYDEGTGEKDFEVILQEYSA